MKIYWMFPLRCVAFSQIEFDFNILSVGIGIPKSEYTTGVESPEGVSINKCGADERSFLRCIGVS